jgi:hypothetical protein
MTKTLGVRPSSTCSKCENAGTSCSSTMSTESSNYSLIDWDFLFASRGMRKYVGEAVRGGHCGFSCLQRPSGMLPYLLADPKTDGALRILRKGIRMSPTSTEIWTLKVNLEHCRLRSSLRSRTISLRGYSYKVFHAGGPNFFPIALVQLNSFS